MKRLFLILIVCSLLSGLLTGCKQEPGNTVQTAAPVDVSFSKTDGDMFTERDQQTDYDENGSIHIQLNGTSAAASSDSVQISETTVTLTREATYILSGTLDNGMIIVNAPENAKLQLVFNGVAIHSQTSAPLYILQADKVFVTLAAGTENTLSNGGSFTATDESNMDAAVFSRQDLTFNGAGSLTVTSPGGHGIVSKDDLVFTGGTYTVASAGHGLDANDSVRMKGVSMTIDAGKDGIHSENTEDASLGFVYLGSGSLQIEAEGDGISAGAYLQMEDGTVQILAGGGSENGTQQSSGSYGDFGGGMPGQRPRSSAYTQEESTSMKGLKAANSLLISGGNLTIDSADDAIHSDVSVVINGGTFQIASGDDAIHAEQTLIITAGTIRITECYEGLEALNIDIRGGDIQLVASDDGLNAAGGTDGSGTTGGRDGMFGPGGMGGGPGGPGGMGGGMSASSNGSILISGGNLYIQASGDGMDANGTLNISGGYTVVVGPTQGDTATLDYDVSATITGGTFIGTGASGMAQTFSGSEQGVIAVRVGNQSAGTNITLKDKAGNIVLSYTPELSFGVVILSSADMVSGETYTITVGTETAEFAAS